MTIDENKIQEHIGQSFSVTKESGVTKLTFTDNGFFIDNKGYYSDIFLGKCDTCDPYKTFFEGFSYDKVLVAGLGLGLLPQTLASEGCSVVDVLEINEELIAWTAQSGHLDPSINIVQGDVYTYKTDAKYDLIIVDTIWEPSEMTPQQQEIIKTSFNPTTLNHEGRLYFPVLSAMIDRLPSED